MNQVRAIFAGAMFILFMLIAPASNGQFSSGNGFWHFSLSDGLPSLRVYRLIQDRSGFIWLATDAGVSRFDGKHFENFTVKDGLGDNDIISLVEDNWGRVWFLSYNGRLSFYANGQIHHAGTDEWLKGVSNQSPILSNFIAKDSTLYLGTARDGIIEIKGESVRHYANSKGSLFGSAAFFLEDSAGRIIVATQSISVRTKIAENIYYDPSFFLNDDSPSLYSCGKGEVFGAKHLSFSKEEILENTGLWINQRFKHGVQTNINRLDWNGSDSIWICTENEGAHLWRKMNNVWNEGKKFLQGENVSGVIRDNENGIWISTLSNGIFRYTGQQLVEGLSFPIGKVDQIVMDGSRPQLAYGLAGISRFDWKEKQVIPLYTPEKSNNLRGITRVGDRIVFGRRAMVTEIDLMGNLIKEFPVEFRGPLPVKSLQVVGRDSFWLGSSGGIYSVFNGEIQSVWPDSNRIAGLVAISFLKVNDGKVYVGTNNGLFLLFPENDGFRDSLLLDIPASINFIKTSPLGDIWAGTNGFGLFQFRAGKLVRKWDESAGLENDVIHQVRFLTGDSILVSHGTGFSLIRTNSGMVRNMGRMDQFRMEPVFDVVMQNDTFWIANTKGVFAVVSEIKDPLIPRLNCIITAMSANGELVSTDTPNNFDYSQGDISLKFAIVSPNFGNETVAEYRINGVEEWTTINSNQLDLISLSPGRYEISIRGRLKGGGQYSNTATLTFIIHPPFWGTWWFISLEILLGLGIVALVVRAYLQSRARRENVARRLTQSRLTALRSQMNPHFIFNSLNSIQNFVANNDHQEAFLYLSRFGKLMRRVLDNSEHDMIPLEEEVDTLELYLQLEQLRSNNGFDFEITIGEELEPEFHEVPPTLIQPMLENAIWHGVMHRETKGKIWLEFSLEKDEVVVCRVRDNGVGRAAAQKMEATYKKDHKSKGLSITQERMALLNERLKSKIAMEIIDLFDGEKKPLGTEVVLRVPNA